MFTLGEQTNGSEELNKTSEIPTISPDIWSLLLCCFKLSLLYIICSGDVPVEKGIRKTVINLMDTFLQGSSNNILLLAINSTYRFPQ